MKCPVCPDSPLVMTERQGVEIDYCPQCRGVWLDRGELDKILERSAAEQVGTAWSGQAGSVQPRRGDCDDDHARSERYPAKRGGFLKDLFD